MSRVSARLSGSMVGLAAAFAAAPMLITAVVFAIKRPLTIFDGDPAVDELALIRSWHFEQLVGNYSRYGWSHPGPAWFFALDTVYQPLGAQSWGLVAATLVLQAVGALLIVMVAWRAAGPVVAVVTAGLLLGYVGLVGDQLFRNVWPPFAVILPMALLLLLASIGAAGSNPGLAGALAAGSYEAQTHVGTVPTVLAALSAAVAVRLVMDYVARRSAGYEARRAGRLDAPLTIGGIALSVVMWIPPIIDEATGDPGNLTVLWKFFTHGGPQHRWREAVSALGHNLDVFQLRELQNLGSTETAVASPGYIAVAVAFGVLCVTLVVAATLIRDRFAQSTGVIVVAALGAITISIRDVIGPVYEYLLFWVTTLPIVIAIAWIDVVIRFKPWRSVAINRNVQVAGAAALLIVIGSLSAARTAEFQNLPGDPINAPRAGYVSALVESATSDPSQPVLLELNSLDTWIMAAAVGLQLVKHGHPIRVHDEWLFMFGRQSRIRGDERMAVVFVRASDAQAYAAQNPNAKLLGATDDYAVFTRRLP